MSALAHVSYEPGRNRVSYDSEGSTLAAHLFLPSDFDAGTAYPAIVLVRPATDEQDQDESVSLIRGPREPRREPEIARSCRRQHG